MTRGLWVFGYGSLVFRHGFPYLEARPARIAGWERRWWQASTDHRGTPERPGRVVTLVPSADSVVTGRAFRVDADVAARVLGDLDHRERGGYDRHLVELHVDGGSLGDVVVYVAGPTNPNWAGPAPLDAMARQIASSVGPSGRNVDYLLHLEAALLELGGDDPETFDLADRVRQMSGQKPTA